MNWSFSLVESLKALGGATARPTVRNFWGTLTPDASSNDPMLEYLKGDPFVPERSYFSVRIAEMHLAEAGRYFVDFLPMCACFLKYTYGHSSREIPFVLSLDRIKAALGANADKMQARNVEFNDVYVVRNVPVKADNLTMYSALCRFNDTGFAQGLLSLVSDVSSVVAGPVAGPVIKTGVDFAGRLATLLGADGVETRFGMWAGSALKKSGYTVALAASGNVAADELSISEGRLMRRVKGAAAEPINDVDYLVMALERRETLVDANFAQVSILPFHETWNAVRSQLLQSDTAGAKKTLQDLVVQVSSSPDVTEADRFAIISTYLGECEKWATLGGKTTMSSAFSTQVSGPPTVVKMFLEAKAAKAQSDREGGPSLEAINEPGKANELLGRRAANTIAAISPIAAKLDQATFRDANRQVLAKLLLQ
ncbi:hypothetical protein [Bradyrhizobium sp. 1]|uniref:hypothetical protein n=1 Tax=Bradyrhizobium sp. 1 TaxID=241591 RepID=UPI001FF78037|nr:hypothetical protein [Bradyrhizobium sp. 1]MCK1396498.1 hypothetical protein [Bradyrhizobium sp. 1]